MSSPLILQFSISYGLVQYRKKQAHLFLIGNQTSLFFGIIAWLSKTVPGCTVASLGRFSPVDSASHVIFWEIRLL